METFGVFQNLGVGELRASDRTTRGIANHRGEIPNDEDGIMALILKIAEFRERDAVAEVDIRSSRIDAELHTERASEFELLGKFLLADDLGAAS